MKDLTGEAPDLGTIRKFKMFIFLGGKDANDSVVFRDGYEEDDEKVIFGLLGANLQDRRKAAEALYLSAGPDCRFVVYPAAGHEITQEMKNDVVKFFLESLKENR